MKNSIAILTTLVFALSFAACASDDDSDKPSSTGKTKVGYMVDNFTIDPADPLCDIIDGNAGENVGSWFTWIDEDAAGTSISPAPAADQFCDATKKDGGAVDGGAYLSVSGKSGGHGVGIGAYFNFSSTKMDPVDFSEFDGLTFWAKGKANITVQLNMPAFMPIDLGGECPESDGNCYNYHSVNVKVDSKDWQSTRLHGASSPKKIGAPPTSSSTRNSSPAFTSCSPAPTKTSPLIWTRSRFTRSKQTG